ncbi:MAG: hypothetical protein ACFCUT_17580 [Kiloniellaceae bacterium]
MRPDANALSRPFCDPEAVARYAEAPPRFMPGAPFVAGLPRP